VSLQRLIGVLFTTMTANLPHSTPRDSWTSAARPVPHIFRREWAYACWIHFPTKMRYFAFTLIKLLSEWYPRAACLRPRPVYTVWDECCF